MLGEEITKAVFADPDTAPISPQLKAALGLVRKLTLSPEEVGADDLRATLKVGVSEDGALDLRSVWFAFNLIDRVADALGFDLMDEGRWLVPYWYIDAGFAALLMLLTAPGRVDRVGLAGAARPESGGPPGPVVN